MSRFRVFLPNRGSFACSSGWAGLRRGGATAPEVASDGSKLGKAVPLAAVAEIMVRPETGGVDLIDVIVASGWSVRYASQRLRKSAGPGTVFCFAYTNGRSSKLKFIEAVRSFSQASKSILLERSSFRQTRIVYEPENTRMVCNTRAPNILSVPDN